MKVVKISRKLIKPHTPTPQNLKNYIISFLDSYMEALTFAFVLFYESKPEDDSMLEESLAKILVEFYPLAGRYIQNDHCVDCSDQGVEFVEAEALDVELMDLVAKTETDQLNDLLPDQYFRVDEAANDPLMSIQATHFRCGGVAIAISVSHVVFDAWSFGAFLAAWSNATNPESNKTVEYLTPPSFDLPSLLPYKGHTHDDSVSNSLQFSDEDEKVVAKRLTFDKVALTRLRSRIRHNTNGKTISRVRVVCAVIAKALIVVDRAKNGGRNRDLVITQAINMRERTITPLPKNACGNFVIPSATRCVAASEAMEIGMEELVDIMGDAVRKSIDEHAEIVCPNRDGRDIIANTYEKAVKQLWNPETNCVSFSDLSKFGFYEADFGWGKPILTTIGPPRSGAHSIVLMSNKEGDGIEAWLFLNQDDMRYLEQDQEIKLFTT